MRLNFVACPRCGVVYPGEMALAIASLCVNKCVEMHRWLIDKVGVTLSGLLVHRDYHASCHSHADTERHCDARRSQQSSSELIAGMHTGLILTGPYSTIHNSCRVVKVLLRSDKQWLPVRSDATLI